MSIQIQYIMVVSVSRRCDIPRFQFDWFMGRISAGYVEAVNPYNARQIKRVSLLPEDVDVLVFWTRDPRKILAKADELAVRSFRYYVMVTVTGYPAALEPSMVRTSKILMAIKELSRKIGADRVIWRYDPIILTSITDEDFHRGNFASLAHELAGSVKQVIISVYDEYREAKKRLEILERMGVLKMLEHHSNLKNESSPLEPHPNLEGESLSCLLADLAKTACDTGMEIKSCAEKEDYSSFGIKPGACIDAALINKLFGLELSGKDKYQRPHCLCCKSIDIGAYGICDAHCVYCYAY